MTKAGFELGPLGTRAHPQLRGLALSCLSVLLTLHSTHSSFPTPCNQYGPLKPIRPDRLPWNAQSPFLSLWFHTTLRMPFLPLPAYPNRYLSFRNKSSATSSKQAALTAWGFILFSQLLYQWHNLGLHFASSFPQYVHSFEQQKQKKLFASQKFHWKFGS